MSRQNLKEARLARLPRIAQRLIANLGVNVEHAQQYLCSASLARLIIAHRISPTPDFGLAEHDAIIAIVKDALGIEPLSDEEFERVLLISTPPECRGTAH